MIRLGSAWPRSMYYGADPPGSHSRASLLLSPPNTVGIAIACTESGTLLCLMPYSCGFNRRRCSVRW